MFQKEVADRIISKFNTPDYGRLSILANWKLDIKKICDIKSSSFSPRPKIDSSLLLFKPKNKFYHFSNPKNLEKITRVFFSQRRKKLKNCIDEEMQLNIDSKSELLEKRPENISIEEFIQLIN